MNHSFEEKYLDFQIKNKVIRERVIRDMELCEKLEPSKVHSLQEELQRNDETLLRINAKYDMLQKQQQVECCVIL